MPHPIALLTLSAALALCGCATAPVPAPQAPAIAPDPSWPLEPQTYRTTSASIYLGNLDARIEELRRIVGERDRNEHRTALAGSLYHRYRVLGRLDDAEEALRLLDAAVAAEPEVPEHRQLRAVVLGGFHRFADALADVEAAADAGLAPEEVHKLRRELQLALGDYGPLRGEFAATRELTADFYELAHRADLRLLQGEPEGAEFLFRAAQSQYRDVNPVPLAWLHVQQGIAYLRHDRVEEARRFFAAAHARLPQYYLAAEHLAECEARLGNFDAARALYREVIAQTSNPEFIAALADVERAAGDEAAAQRLQAEALARYETLLRAHPSAFGQHAAEFLVAIGQAPRADALAQQNLQLRRDVGSWILAAQTAEAVGDLPRACQARERAVETAMRPPELAELDALAVRCRDVAKDDRAAAGR
jgi:tetratricopeptide (TPR) repeat protein